jgi:hypothetical protein
MFGIKAQRVNLDKFWFNYSYRRLPNYALDKSYMTYSVDVSKTVSIGIFANESLANRINIEGRKKLPSGVHFTVYISMEDLFIDKTEVKERVEINKDRDGKETGRSHYYHVEVIYTFAASAYVRDYQGNILSNYTLADRTNNKAFSSNEYSTYNDAANYFNNNKVEIKTKLITDEVNSALNSLNSDLNDDFGYRVISYREYLWSIGTKKHSEYTANQDACTKAKSVLELITANDIPAGVNEQIQPMVDYLKSIASKYTNIEEKGELKIRYSAFYNLAMIYYLTEQPEKAIEFANKLIENDYDVKDGEGIIKDCKRLTSDFEKHQINTRHFSPDLENALPPQ